MYNLTRFVRDRAVTRSIRLLAFASLIVLSLAGACAANRARMSPDGVARDSDATLGCTVRREPDRNLTLEDGREAFVLPQTMIATGDGRVILAGINTYVYWRTAEGRLRSTDDSIIGAQILPDGRAIGIPAPTRQFRIDQLRAVALGGNRVGFTFFETVPAPWPPGGNPRVVAVWYAEYDGSAWSPLEQIPIPAALGVRYYGTSRLIRGGDTLALAIPATREPFNDVVVATRVHGRWSSTALGLRGAAELGLERVPGLGLTLAVTQPDPSLRSDWSSLFLYTAAPVWRMFRKVAHGGDSEPNYAPEFFADVDDAVLTWRTRAGRDRVIRTTLRVRGTAGVHVLDSSGAHFVVVRGMGAPTWILDHEDPSGAQQILLLRARGDSITTIARVDNPYIGMFGAVAATRDRIVIAGPPERAVLARAAVPSLLLTLRIVCAGAAD